MRLPWREKERKKERQRDKESEREIYRIYFVSAVAGHIKCSGDIFIKGIHILP